MNLFLTIFIYFRGLFFLLKTLTIQNKKRVIMSQKESSNELISRMINDVCQLIFIWVKKKN
jgi:hypothetical protein